MSLPFKHLCLICLVLWSVAPAVCQEQTENTKPDLKVNAILVTQIANWAITTDTKHTRVLKSGQKLGDYTVEIGPKNLRISYQDEENDLTYSYPLDDGNGGATAIPDAPLDTESVANAFMLAKGNFVVQLLSQAFEKNTMSAVGLNSKIVKVVARQASFQELLKQVMGDEYVATKIDGLTVICEPSRLQAITEISPAWESKKLITLQLVDAELLYLFKVLAKEANKDIVVAPDISGSANIQVTNAPIGLVFPLLLQLQQQPMEFTKRDDLILVYPVGRLAGREHLQAKTTHPNLNPKVTFDFVNADLNYVIAVLAEEGGLQAKIDGEVEGAVTITAHDRSLQEVLTMVLETQETVCDWDIDGSNLKVWTGEPDNFNVVNSESFLESD
jgi:hypothetical protein